MVKVTYINHINEVIDFNSNGLYITDTDLHDYKWTYKTDNNKINNLARGVVEKKLIVVIANRDRDTAVNIANSLMECTEKDVLTKNQGKLYFDDYYIPCYISTSSKSNYNENKGFLEIELKVISDAPAWIKENNKNFSPNDSAVGGQNLDFPFDFSYDFASSSQVKSLVNTSFIESDFKLIIYGQATDPLINIGNHAYGITGSIGMREYLTIDSKNKTIVLTKLNGEQVNYFNKRNRNSYIFQKIAAGENAITWSGDFNFDIVLYEERSEPKWI